ncbi:LapA family protein [Evansella halocellulosilytica]|uniref:LapA family protein n=1 Tax=Evansella halocellulosilytica TaxID=2011013 RepID=UPI000BB96F83|nr:lipopolysaccharide assembly protein LapA domain-containing protein [Evansella halocellulosilytica]
MRGQWGLIIGIIVVLIIAIFSVINVDPVEVNYLFGQSEWPLVLIIIGSVLMGGIIVGSVGMYKIYRLQQEIKRLSSKQGERSQTTVKEKNKNKNRNEDKANDAALSKKK